MQLIEIDKTRYRRHLNRVIVACIIALALGSLAISQTLIAFFPDPSGSHFHWNLTGVIMCAVLVGYTLHKYRSHPFMHEVVFVWDLKQALNKINRKMPKLKEASVKGDINAMIAIQFSFSGSRYLWELDDNSIVMEELILQQADLDVLAKQYNVTLKADAYQESILQQY